MQLSREPVLGSKIKNNNSAFREGDWYSMATEVQ